MGTYSSTLTGTNNYTNIAAALDDGTAIEALDWRTLLQLMLNNSLVGINGVVGTWIDDVDPSNGGGNNTADSAVFDEGGSAWIVVGGAGESTASQNGVYWADIGPNGLAGTNPVWSATKRPAALPVHVGFNTLIGNSGNSVSEYTGAWATLVLPGLPVAVFGTYDEFNQLWIVVGADTGAPSVWYDGTPIAGFTQVLPPAGPTSTQIIAVAAAQSAGVVVGIGNLTPFDVFTSADGMAWATAVPTGIVAGEFARSITWVNPTIGFLMLTDKSAYTSVNGTAWTLKGTRVNGSFGFRYLVADSSLYFSFEETGSPRMTWSWDGGITWNTVEVPNGQAQPSTPLVSISKSTACGNLMATWRDSPNAGRVARSLALNPTNRIV